MRYETIADIYTANEKIRAGLNALASSVTPDEAAFAAAGETWTPEHLVEHVAMVTGGVAQICSRLVRKAKEGASPSDGSFSLSPALAEQFAQNGTAKLEAPDIVKPAGGVPITESLNRLNETQQAFAALRVDLESMDISTQTFPHPYFGPLNAAEWFALAGLHESRHTRQLEQMLAKIRNR